VLKCPFLKVAAFLPSSSQNSSSQDLGRGEWGGVPQT